MHKQLTEQLDIDFDRLADAAAILLNAPESMLAAFYDDWCKALCDAVPGGTGARRELIRLGQAIYNRRAAQLGLPNRRGFM